MHFYATSCTDVDLSALNELPDSLLASPPMQQVQQPQPAQQQQAIQRQQAMQQQHHQQVHVQPVYSAASTSTGTSPSHSIHAQHSYISGLLTSPSNNVNITRNGPNHFSPNSQVSPQQRYTHSQQVNHSITPQNLNHQLQSPPQQTVTVVSTFCPFILCRVIWASV